jgi:DNA-binding transcriptional MerR regulator
MNQAKRAAAPFAVGAAARLTGLSAHVLRSWERRYSAVRPQRTPGGSRRYTESDLVRLRLLREAIEEGHPISALAPLSDAEIAGLLDTRSDASKLPFDEVLGAIARLDAREVERLFEFQLFARGSRGFARDFVLPLFVEIGARWETGRLSIAAEHMATFVAGNLLGGALRTAPLADGLPPILFTTPAGERHEFGVLVAALIASSAGADVIYLGPDLPAEEVARAVKQVNARAVALSVATLDPGDTASYLRTLRRDLDRNVSVWIGGDGGRRIKKLPDGFTLAESYDDLEALILKNSAEATGSRQC